MKRDNLLFRVASRYFRIRRFIERRLTGDNNNVLLYDINFLVKIFKAVQAQLENI